MLTWTGFNRRTASRRRRNKTAVSDVHGAAPMCFNAAGTPMTYEEDLTQMRWCRNTRPSFVVGFVVGAALFAFLLVTGERGFAQSPGRALLGAWDLRLETPAGERPSWIRISNEGAGPEVLMVGFAGHATPVRAASLRGASVEFTAAKDDFGFPAEMLFRGRLAGDELLGTATDTDGDHWCWRGTKAPALERTGTVRWGAPTPLFNGKNLDGWRLRDAAKTGTWTAADGALRTSGRGSDLITKATFDDFKLHLEFMAGPDANTGVYLRGRYEVQIETDSAAEPPSHHTGGVYGFLAPTPEQPRLSGLWQSLDITLVGRDLSIAQNGVTVIDHRTIPGITGGALDSDERRPGPVMLQGDEGGEVRFRNIVLTPALR